MIKNEGIVIDPEIDDLLDADYDPNNPGNREYFARAANAENIDKLLANADIGNFLLRVFQFKCIKVLAEHVNRQNWLIISNTCLGKDEKSDSDIDDGATEFEIRAKRMFNVLDDGGVKKKVITFLVNASTQRI